jgi:hypothetical protein
LFFLPCRRWAFQGGTKILMKHYFGSFSKGFLISYSILLCALRCELKRKFT